MLRIRKSVVRLTSAITNNRNIPDSEHNMDSALNYEDQLKIRDLIAVQWKWKKHNVESRQFLKIRSFLQLLENFQVHVQANHRETDIN